MDNSSSPSGSGLSNTISDTLVFGLFGISSCATLILLVLVCVFAIMRRSGHLRSGDSSWLGRRENTSITSARIRGLDAKFVEALPTIVYTSQNLKGEEKVECTICLSEFEEGEKVRVLPNCKHSFHIECIDMWFTSHSNCPVCRIHVEVQAQAVTVDDKIEEARSANGSDNVFVAVEIGVIEEGQGSGGGVEEGSNSFSSPRECEDISSFNASHSPRFSRLHSLKRMLSRGRAEKAFPPNESEGQSDS